MPPNSTEAAFFCKVKQARHSYVQKWKCIWWYPQKQVLIGPMQNLCSQYKFLVPHCLLLKNSPVEICCYTSMQGPSFINYNRSHTLLEKALSPSMILLLSLLTYQFSAFVLNLIKYYLRTGITIATFHRKGVLTVICLFKLSISDLHVRRFT